MKRVALPTLLICSLSSVFVCESSSPYRVSLAPYAPDAGHHGLYLFRIPVSVLPGREITEEYSAVPILLQRRAPPASPVTSRPGSSAKHISQDAHRRSSRGSNTENPS